MRTRPFGGGGGRREHPSRAYGCFPRVVNARPKWAVLGLMVAMTLVYAPSAAADPLRLLALGDSLTAGYGLPHEDAFPVRLEAALRARGHAVVVLDAGVSGDTTAGGRARLDWVLADDPDAAIVALGGNDGLRGLNPAGTRENLRAIVDRLQGEGMPVLIAGMLAPPNLGQDYGSAFNTIFPEVAEETGALLYPFFLEGVAAEPALNQADGIHPTAEGVAVMVAGILPAVEALLTRVEK